mgnify:CR=1 FL=1
MLKSDTISKKSYQFYIKKHLQYSNYLFIKNYDKHSTNSTKLIEEIVINSIKKNLSPTLYENINRKNNILIGRFFFFKKIKLF